MEFAGWRRFFLTVGAIAAGLGGLGGLLLANASADPAAAGVTAHLCVAYSYSSQLGRSLNGVAAGRHAAAWAVGSTNNGQVLIEHRTAGRWELVPGADPGGRHCTVLSAVATAGPTDAWAVGYYSDGKALRTLIEHWNGRTWRQVPSPSPAGSHVDSTLTSVTTSGPSSAWAVGFSVHSFGPPRAGYGTTKTLIEHWNGRVWTTVPSPNPGGVHAGRSSLAGVAASGPSSAWAVGAYHRDTNHRTHTKPLILHWDGRVWRPVDSPSFRYGGYLSAIAVTRSGHAWAVGDRITAVGQTLIERWNGSAWKQIPSPRPPRSHGSELFSIATTGPSGAWAVGDYVQAAKSNEDLAVETLIDHWNGRAWKQVPSPSPGGSTESSGDQSTLSGVTAASRSRAWAVGRYSPGTNPRASRLIEHWTGQKWSVATS
jgi:hypothetical protein